MIGVSAATLGDQASPLSVPRSTELGVGFPAGWLYASRLKSRCGPLIPYKLLQLIVDAIRRSEESGAFPASSSLRNENLVAPSGDLLTAYILLRTARLHIKSLCLHVL